MCKCVRLLVFLVIFFCSLDANASVPPEYKELTRAEMKSLGFKYRLLKDAAGSTMDWHFPKSVRGDRFTLVPHSSRVIVRNLAGDEIGRTTNWVAGNNFMSIETSYDHKVSDVSLSITYTCPGKGESGCYGATTLGILSVSKFMDANPDLVNLRPKCRNITSLVIDCTKYESDEYP
jgi:hypothetical protein